MASLACFLLLLVGAGVAAFDLRSGNLSVQATVAAGSGELVYSVSVPGHAAVVGMPLQVGLRKKGG